MSQDKDAPQQTRKIFEKTVSNMAGASFTSRDFIDTMRNSELRGDEEFENSLGYGIWHAYLDAGISWLQQKYPDFIEKKTEKKYDFEKPTTDPSNFWLIRNRLKMYSKNLTDGVAFYDIHEALLNGRFARDRKHKGEVVKVITSFHQREEQPNIFDEPEGGKKHHFWSRGTD